MKRSLGLKNKRILITAGPTWIPIDSVRVITNIFKGTLGLIIAKEAIKRKAKVTLLMGPGAISLPSKIPFSLKIMRFKFFNDLYQLMKKEINSKKYNIVIHSSAVSDYQLDHIYKGKIKSGKKRLILRLKPTIKIVDQIKKWDPKVFLVKFKVEDNKNKSELIEIAFKSMLHSKADLIVANDLRNIKEKNHRAFIIDHQKNIVSCKTKEEIARQLLNIIDNEIQRQ